MSKLELPVQDVDPSSTGDWPTIKLTVSPETLQRLKELEKILAPQRSYTRSKTRPLSRRDLSIAFSEWCNKGLSSELRARASEISLNSSLENAREFLFTEFKKTLPEQSKLPKAGRPDWYIPPQTVKQLLLGEVIAHLLNNSYYDVRKQLSGKIRAA